MRNAKLWFQVVRCRLVLAGLCVNVTMPLVPQYTWEESDKTITIVITAPGLSKAKTDLLISDLQVRVSSQPYLLQLDLRYAIDEAETSAVFAPSQLSLRLSKVRQHTFGQNLSATP